MDAARDRIAPEVAEPDRPPDAASDVYTLEIPGAVLAPGGGKRPRSDPQVVAVFEARRRLSAGALAAYQRFPETQAAAGAPQ